MTPPCVQLCRITKRFRDLLVVDDLSLDVRAGEFFTLLGPSGCGKTTTLRLVAGFEQPTAGHVRIDGSDVTEMPPHRRPTNMVFQSYALFPHLNVRENVAFGLRRKRISRGDVERRVAAELERVGLADQANRKPRELSGGMQQRVALARALVNAPKVLLLDEPLGALDLRLRKALQAELKGIQREVGITFVYVTHDQEEALTMSDRIAVMNDGRVEQLDTPAHVYERPATTFVAEFIGVSNLLPGTVGAYRGDLTMVHLDLGLVVEVPGRVPRRGHPCHLMVRPERVRVAPAGGWHPDSWPSVAGVVESSAYMGTSTQLVVRLAGDQSMTALLPNGSERERASLPGSGAEVRLAWAPEHMHIVGDSGRSDRPPAATEPTPAIAGGG